MSKVDWKGFDTFILNAGIKSNKKNIIIYIFASTLYNCTSLLDYNLRLLNAYVYYLDAKDTSKNIKNAWNAFILKMTTVAEVTTIATKLLVLIYVNTDGAGKINMNDAYDNTKPTYITDIVDSVKITLNDEYNVITSIQVRVDKGFDGIEQHKGILFNWNGFDNFFVKVTDADARSYICNYFISELDNANAPDANEDSDAYILFKQLILENDDESHINALNTAVETDATLINTLSKNLKYLFEYTDINTSIETKTVDALKCFGDADTELITVMAANAPVAKPISPFDKNALPAGWQPYNMVNIASYNITNLNTTTKIDNVIAFLTNVTAGTSPYNKFRPDIITLQNTSELMTTDTTKYNTLKTAIEAQNYLVFEHEDGTSKKKDKLITLIKKDYFAKGGGKTYNNDPFIGYLDAAHKQYYLASIIQKYKIIVINVVDITGAQIPFTSIKDSAIEPIIKANAKIDISNYDMIITGTINHGYTSPVYVKNYEHSICTYNKADIKDSYIISTGFKAKAVYPYDFSGTGVKFETDYSNSRPIGKRMFQDPAKAPKKATSASSTKVGVKVKCTKLLKDIATELDKLSQKQINQILASVSAPNTAPAAPKKKTTSAKATPVATPPIATPPKGSKINMHVISEINVHAAEADGMLAATGFTGPCDTKTYIQFKTGKSGSETDKKVNIIYDAAGTKVSGDVFKLTGEEKYCIKVNIGGSDYFIHNILIDSDKVYFNDTSGGKTDIDITTHVTTSAAKKAPSGKPIYIPMITEIDFSSITDFKLSNFKTVPTASDYAIFNDNGKGTNFKINIKITAKLTVIINQDAIFCKTKNKNIYYFKVTVTNKGKTTDFYITGIRITDKITININKNTIDVPYK